MWLEGRRKQKGRALLYPRKVASPSVMSLKAFLIWTHVIHELVETPWIASEIKSRFRVDIFNIYLTLSEIVSICTDNIIFAHRPIAALTMPVTRAHSQQIVPPPPLLRSSLVSSSRDYSEETGQQLLTNSFHMKPKTHHYQNEQNGANKNIFTDFLGFK